MSTSLYSILLIDYGVSYYYYYVHPVISFFAICLCILSTIVLASKELRTSGAFFQYSLINSAGSIIGTFLLLFLFFTRCGGSPCSISTTYWQQIYLNYIAIYVYVNYYVISGVIQIAIGFQLYFSIKQKYKLFTNISPYKFCFIMTCLSAVSSTILIFINKIDTFTITSVEGLQNVTQTYYYSLAQTNSPILSLLVVVIVGVSTYLFFIVLVGVNILNYRELRKLMENKRRMFGRPSMRASLSKHSSRIIEVQPRISIQTTNQSLRAQEDLIKSIVRASVEFRQSEESKVLRRSLIITLWISVIFSANRFVKLIYRTMVFVNQYSPFTYYLNVFSYLLDLIMYSAFFFVYMKTNKIFKRKFYEIILRRKEEDD